MESTKRREGGEAIVFNADTSAVTLPVTYTKADEPKEGGSFKLFRRPDKIHDRVKPAYIRSSEFAFGE